MIFILHRKGLRKESPGDGSVGLLSFWILTLGPVLALALNLAPGQDLALNLVLDLALALNLVPDLALALNLALNLAPVLSLALDLALASSPLVQALGLSQDVLTVKQ